MKKLKMRVLCLSFLLGISVLPAGPAFAQAARFSALLHPQMSRALGLNPQAGFDVDNQGRAYINTSRGIYNLKDGSYLQTTDLNAVSSFAVDSLGGIIAIQNRKLISVRDGREVGSLGLPSPGMKAALHGDTLWIYGGGQGAGAVFLVNPDGRHQKMLEAEQPVTAVAASGTELFLATGNLVYRASWGDEIELIAAVPEDISSLAYDSTTGTLFFASGGSVFAMVEGEIGLIAEKMGDDQRFRNGALYAYSPGSQTLFRLEGVQNLKEDRVENAPTAPGKPSRAQRKYQQATELAADGKHLQAYWAMKEVIRLAPEWDEPYYSAGTISEHMGYTRDFRFIGESVKLYQGFLEHTSSYDPRRETVKSKVETLSYIDQWMPVTEGGKYTSPMDVGMTGGLLLVWSLLCMFLFF